MNEHHPTPSAASPEGGQGAGLPTRSDLVLVGRAIRQRWLIPDATRRELGEKLAAVVADPDSSVREVLGAGKVLLLADAQNLEQEKRDGAIPDRLDVTTNGEKLPGGTLTLTAADLAAARDLLRGLGMAGD